MNIKGVKMSLNCIMYIEDDPDIQKIVKISLEQVGKFKVIICSSGHEALNMAPNLNPDLLLLDVMLPGMDGISLLKCLRQIPQFANIPVIFMTAKSQVHEVNGYMNLGIADVIIKPFDPMILPQSIKNIWERHYG